MQLDKMPPHTRTKARTHMRSHVRTPTDTSFRIRKHNRFTPTPFHTLALSPSLFKTQNYVTAPLGREERRRIRVNVLLNRLILVSFITSYAFTHHHMIMSSSSISSIYHLQFVMNNLKSQVLCRVHVHLHARIRMHALGVIIKDMICYHQRHDVLIITNLPSQVRNLKSYVDCATEACESITFQSNIHTCSL